MDILSLYKKYPVTQNLQEHQMRAASVGAYICDNWKDHHMVDRKVVIQTLLLHDMGNIIKYDLENPSLLTTTEKENIHHWREQKKIFTEKYKEEHEATYQIARDLQVNEKVQYILHNTGSSNLQYTLQSDNWELKIVSYSDLRCAPHGVVTVMERFDDLIKRYEGRSHALSDKEMVNKLRYRCLEIEKQLQENVIEELNQITDEWIEVYKDEIAHFLI